MVSQETLMSSLLGSKQSPESPQKGRTGLIGRLDEKQPSARASSSDEQTDIRPATAASKEAEARRLEKIREIKDLVQEKALAQVKKEFGKSDPADIRPLIESIFKTVLSEGNYLLNRRERIDLFEEIVNLLVGFGQLEKLLADEYTTDIMIVGGARVFVERKGRIFQTNILFDNEEEVVRIIERIVAPLGRRIDEASPMVDARMPDGSRINAVIRPVALDGPSLTIRKFSKVPLSMTDLVTFNTATLEVFEFLSACVVAGANILVSGGSGSGKTTLLNVLSGASRTPPSWNLSSRTSSAWKAARPTSKKRAKSPSRNWSSTRCACALTASWWARCAPARRLTCCRP
jgi:pilus assembly protein CpaF